MGRARGFRDMVTTGTEKPTLVDWLRAGVVVAGWILIGILVAP